MARKNNNEFLLNKAFPTLKAKFVSGKKENGVLGTYIVFSSYGSQSGIIVYLDKTAMAFIEDNNGIRTGKVTTFNVALKQLQNNSL